MTASTRIGARNTMSLAEYRQAVGLPNQPRISEAKATNHEKPAVATAMPSWLAQLLCRWPFRGRLSAEERLAIAVADELRRLSLEGRLRCAWTHVPNQSDLPRSFKLAALIQAKKKAMGAIPGAGDLVFTPPGGWIELKVDERPQTRMAVEDGQLKARDGTRGQLSTPQRRFRDWCALHDAPHEVARSVDEVLAILRSWQVLT